MGIESGETYYDQVRSRQPLLIIYLLISVQVRCQQYP
jgi:hypothetical protein